MDGHGSVAVFASIRVYLRLRVLAPGDSFVRKIQELGAAAAHLDGDVAQGSALELQTGRLTMIRTADRFQLAGGVLFKFLYRHPQSILA